MPASAPDPEPGAALRRLRLAALAKQLRAERGIDLTEEELESLLTPSEEEGSDEP